MNEVTHATQGDSTKCKQQGPNDGRTEVADHVTCTACQCEEKISAHGIDDWLVRLLDDLYVDNVPPPAGRIAIALESAVKIGIVLEQKYPTTPKPTGVRDLRFLQVNLPWSPNYSQDFRSNPQSHKDFAHAILHIVKAAGKLATICEDWDHHRPGASGGPITDLLGIPVRETATKALADVVICALRAATVCPGGSVDLGQSVVDRIETKNGVRLT